MMPNDDDDDDDNASEQSGREGKPTHGLSLRKRTHGEISQDECKPASQHPEKRKAESGRSLDMPSGVRALHTTPRDFQLEQGSRLQSVNQNPLLYRGEWSMCVPSRSFYFQPCRTVSETENLLRYRYRETPCARSLGRFLPNNCS